jgi:hypothetical protein
MSEGSIVEPTASIMRLPSVRRRAASFNCDVSQRSNSFESNRTSFVGISFSATTGSLHLPHTTSDAGCSTDSGHVLPRPGTRSSDQQDASTTGSPKTTPPSGHCDDDEEERLMRSGSGSAFTVDLVPPSALEPRNSESQQGGTTLLDNTLRSLVLSFDNDEAAEEDGDAMKAQRDDTALDTSTCCSSPTRSYRRGLRLDDDTLRDAQDREDDCDDDAAAGGTSTLEQHFPYDCSPRGIPFMLQNSRRRAQHNASRNDSDCTTSQQSFSTSAAASPHHGFGQPTAPGGQISPLLSGGPSPMARSHNGLAQTFSTLRSPNASFARPPRVTTPLSRPLVAPNRPEAIDARSASEDDVRPDVQDSFTPMRASRRHASLQNLFSSGPSPPCGSAGSSFRRSPSLLGTNGPLSLAAGLPLSPATRGSTATPPHHTPPLMGSTAVAPGGGSRPRTPGGIATPLQSSLRGSRTPTPGRGGSRQPPTKPLLVLDLDRTLIFADTDRSVCAGDFTVDCGGQALYVDMRPRLKTFLQHSAQMYRLALFTAASEDYGRPIAREIERRCGVSFETMRFSQHCKRVHTPGPLPVGTFLESLPALTSNSAVTGGALRSTPTGRTTSKARSVKDLSAFNEPLSRVVLVDDVHHSFSDNPRNGILIDRYSPNRADDAELDRVFRVLYRIATSAFMDVRDALEELRHQDPSMGRHAATASPSSQQQHGSVAPPGIARASILTSPMARSVTLPFQQLGRSPSVEVECASNSFVATTPNFSFSEPQNVRVSPAPHTAGLATPKLAYGFDMTL